MSRDDAPSTYLAYLLRLWPVETEAGPVWRAVLEEPHSAESHIFVDLSALCRFLNDRTAAALDLPDQRDIRSVSRGEEK
ncbi:MAG: hypothetical protein ACP5HM_14100 [Anaerolineae bacterium]